MLQIDLSNMVRLYDTVLSKVRLIKGFLGRCDKINRDYMPTNNDEARLIMDYTKTMGNYARLKLRLSSLVSKYNESVFISLVLAVLSLNKPFFIAHYYDFRGRIYPVSMVSPTYNKYIRGLIRFGDPLNRDEA